MCQRRATFFFLERSLRRYDPNGSSKRRTGLAPTVRPVLLFMTLEVPPKSQGRTTRPYLSARYRPAGSPVPKRSPMPARPVQPPWHQAQTAPSRPHQARRPHLSGQIPHIHHHELVMQKGVGIQQEGVGGIGIDHELVDLAQPVIIRGLHRVIRLPVRPMAEPAGEQVSAKLVENGGRHDLKVGRERVQP
jgi:hypothetical protein